MTRREKAKLFGFVLVISQVIVAGVFWHNGRFVVSRLPVNLKGIPSHGLTLIGPPDPLFDEATQTFFRGMPVARAKMFAIAPLAVFVNNKSGRLVVAYELRWDVGRPDGSVESSSFAYTNPRALMDGGAPGEEAQGIQGLFSIKAGSMRLVSPAFSLAESDPIPSVPDDDTIRELAHRVLAGASNITISLDGVFFDDGFFVGPDSIGFFANFKAQVDANHDLLEWLATSIRNNGGSPEPAFSEMAALIKRTDGPLSAEATPTDYYRYHMANYAKEILQARDKLGADAIIRLKLAMLRKPWVALHKGGTPSTKPR